MTFTAPRMHIPDEWRIPRAPLPPYQIVLTAPGSPSATTLPYININEIAGETYTRDPFEYDRGDLRARANWDLP